MLRRIFRSKRKKGWARYVGCMGEEREELYTGCWWENLREKGHWEDPDVDGRTILRWIFRKLDGGVGTGWS
jgi:hypothetical protein